MVSWREVNGWSKDSGRTGALNYLSNIIDPSFVHSCLLCLSPFPCMAFMRAACYQHAEQSNPGVVTCSVADEGAPA